MKFYLAIGALCLAVLAVADGAKYKDQEGHWYNHRSRLGHFGKDIYMNLYRDYVAAFIKPLMNIDDHDYRVFTPSGEQCVETLREFVTRKYSVKQIEDFIKVDACLGYIFTSKHLEEDKQEFPHIANHIEQYVQDEELKRIFEGTEVGQFNDDGKKCLGNLLHQSIRVRDQFKHLQCNNHWLLIFNRFAECQEEFFEKRDSDTYLKIIYEVTVKRANECFNQEIKMINEATHKYFGRWWNVVSNSVGSRLGNKLKGMSNNRLWPAPISDLLAFVQNNDQEVSLRVIAGYLRGVNDNRFTGFRERFLKNLSVGATNKLGSKKVAKKFPNDPDGSLRYRTLIDNMCQFFRKSDNEKNYDFSTPFIRMIRMTQYEKLYGISEEYFVENVLRKATATAPVYLAASACNILAFTEAHVVSNIANGNQQFEVTFVPDTSAMILWPDAGDY